jgi:hypothetical protein
MSTASKTQLKKRRITMNRCPYLVVDAYEWPYMTKKSASSDEMADKLCV